MSFWTDDPFYIRKRLHFEFKRLTSSTMLRKHKLNSPMCIKFHARLHDKKQKCSSLPIPKTTAWNNSFYFLAMFGRISDTHVTCIWLSTHLPDVQHLFTSITQLPVWASWFTAGNYSANTANQGWKQGTVISVADPENSERGDQETWNISRGTVISVADPETSERGDQETWNISRRIRRPSFWAYFLQGRGGMAPLPPPPGIRYWICM